MVEIDPETLRQVREMFRELENPVRLRFFRPEGECRFCEETEEILKILASLSDKLSAEVNSEGSPEAVKYDLPMYPALLVHGKEEYNVRFFGIPAGYEFGALVEDILDVSRGAPSMNPLLRRIVREKIRRRVRIMVFVTPTCPYCPLAVRAAHKMAMANPLVYGDMIEAMEFPDLANRYNVFTVPKNVIQVDGQDVLEFEGAVPDAYLVAQVLSALGENIPSELKRAMPYSRTDREFTEL